jgi:hypothetical protein
MDAAHDQVDTVHAPVRDPREGVGLSHEEMMRRIVARFYTVCMAPTRRFRRTLCGVSLVSALVMIVVALGVIDPMTSPVLFFALAGLSLVLLALSVRLALNEVRDVRHHYRRSKRDLFVSTFSDEEFQRKVRAKRARARADTHDDLETPESADG